MNKGFTLIELLAVIVILAVLALIATPIVLNIIDDSKKNATLRSSENYIKAIEFSIAKSVMENKRLNDGEYPIMTNGSICLGTLTGSNCTDTLVVEVSGETPESGTITIKSRKIDSYEFTYKSGFVVVNGEIGNGEVKQICKLLDGSVYEIGSKYECEVKDDTKYNFYILSKEDNGTINLIMDRSIGISDVGIGDDEALTPIIEELYNNTKDWINVPLLNFEYEDFSSVNGVVTLNGTKIIGENLLRSRLPIAYVEVSSYNDDNWYLYDYLDNSRYNYAINGIEGDYGYWTFTPYLTVYCDGTLTSPSSFGDTDVSTIRPVINLPLGSFK